MESKIYRHLVFNSAHLQQVLTILKDAGGFPRIIGGAVRDALLGKVQGDIDIATTLTPDNVILAFAQYNIKVIPTGIQFGTVTVVISNEMFEITSLRKDIKCDGRHASVEFTDDFELDSQRRDFTINALSYCPFDGIIYDYHDGISDLHKGIVKFIGIPSERIKEDYLRILRFFRFSAYYADNIDKEGLRSCVDNKQYLATLPQERINQEMHKLVVAENTKNILFAMKDCRIDVFKPLELSLGYIDQLYVVSKKYLIIPKLSTIYAVLFYNNDIHNLKDSLRQLLFSKKMISDIHGMISLLQEQKIVTKIKEMWVDHKESEQYFLFISVLDKIDSNISNILYQLLTKEPKVFPVKSKDLMNIGYCSKELGVQLNLLKQKWIESDFILTKDQLMMGK